MASPAGGPFIVPDEFIRAPPAGYLETRLYVKHLVFKGATVHSFSYDRLDNTTFVEFLSSRRGPQSLDRLLSVTFNPAGRPNDDMHSLHCQIVLERGILFSGSVYRFLGHSNSQLKDKTCFLINDSPENIYDLLALFGEFSKIKSLAKRAKRIGLLFSTFRRSLDLEGHMYEVIPDVERGKYNFTDGCGFMSEELAGEIQRLQKTDHLPCVAQIRYQGFKGILLLQMGLGLKVQFRESMRKFKIPDETMRQRCTTLGVVEISRPYSLGYLNTQIAMLLADGGVSHTYLKDLQEDYYYSLDSLGQDRHKTAHYLSSAGKVDLLQKMERLGMHDRRVQDELRGIRNREIGHMTRDDRDESNSAAAQDTTRPSRTGKLRVFVPKARLVFGVCDPFEELDYGECFFQPTLLDEEQMNDFYGAEQVIVVRNPCYHPGDVRVLRLVKDKPRYAHLSDCLVFPVRGPRPHADESSGGDLDGDKFFVSWDVNLIPPWQSRPFDYSYTSPVDFVKGWISERVGRSAEALKLAIQRFGQEHMPSVCGTPDEAETGRKLRARQKQLAYFANYSNELVGRVDAIFMKYASRYGPSCQECVFLNGFFSAAVDMVAQRERVLWVLRTLEREFHRGPQPRHAVRRFCAYMGWTKPLFRPGDDVWTAMQQRASEFVERMGRR